MRIKVGEIRPGVIIVPSIFSRSVTRTPTATDRFDGTFDSSGDAHRRHLLDHSFTMEGDIAELEAVVNAAYKYGSAGTDTGDQATRESLTMTGVKRFSSRRVPHLKNESNALGPRNSIDGCGPRSRGTGDRYRLLSNLTKRPNGNHMWPNR